MRRFAGRPGTRKAAVAVALLTSITLVGCGQIARGESPLPGTNGGGSKTGAGTGSNQPSPATPSPTPDPVTMRTNVRDGADGVKVNKVIKVSADNGKLAKVTVTGRYVDHGETKSISIDGELNHDKTGWTASELLEPNGDYTVKMVGVSDHGVKRSSTSTFTSDDLSLDRQIYPSFNGTLGGTVGVGTPVVLTFDRPVKDKATFEKHLHVTSTSHQKGSWHWYSDQEVHWRPAKFWKPGTRVTATADLNSIPAGNGEYGQQDASTSFTVSDSVITKVNLASDVGKIYRNGKLVRTILVSAGKPGWETRSGTSLITQKAMHYRMTSQMIGLPKKGPKSYDLTVKYALRITNSGEFLHSAPWNSAYFGKQNASHGCIGMSESDAGWLYENAPSGSPVVVTGTDRGLEPLNGLTDWNADFKTYAEGSAL
ncbi:Ig-like domain-containing protein [Microlunatus sp. Gsoil 973]|uniref:L,D-transpeptidase n=1 Tax=Microlunatus sp. Gsoil 973 TaxID=2672569 RepID=UPI0012B45357|nr:Ig-like domain-containing protein [Microlunatus sp. Gsoil 973]QGN33503.1 L,D-transpeptidase family protein [Microlunatus sp. Gsoil 973]